MKRNNGFIFTVSMKPGKTNNSAMSKFSLDLKINILKFYTVVPNQGSKSVYGIVNAIL